MATRGSRMGANAWPTTRAIYLAKMAGLGVLAFAPELWWYWPNSSRSSLDLSPVRAAIDALHSVGMGAVVKFFGAPPWINPSSSPSAGYKRYPTNSTQRAEWAWACAEYAKLLDPARDWLVILNEPPNPDFNYGLQPASDIAPAFCECVLATRAAAPTLKIIGLDLHASGDLNNPEPTQKAMAMSVYMAALIAADARIVGTAKPDLWGVHPYIWSGGQSDTSTSDPSNLAHGWNGHAQSIALKALLAANGITSPKLVITEHGEPSTPVYNPARPGDTYFSEEWQAWHAFSDLATIDAQVTAGTYDPQLLIRHNLQNDPSISIDGAHRFGMYREDSSRTPMGDYVATIAAQNLPGDTPPPDPVPPTPPATTPHIRTGDHWGTTANGLSTLELDYAAATGARWVRLITPATADPTSLGDWIEYARTLHLRVLLTALPTTWTDLDQADHYRTLATTRPAAIEIGTRPNDPTWNDQLALTPNYDFTTATARLALAAAAAIANPSIRLLTATMGPATIPSRLPHRATGRLAAAHGRDLTAARLQAGITGNWPSGNPNTTTTDPTSNPLAHLPELRRAMRRGNWPAPLWITELGRPAQTGENTATADAAVTTWFNNYAAKITALRQTATPITRIFWDRLRDTQPDQGGLYKTDGTPRAALTTFTTAMATAWKA